MLRLIVAASALVAVPGLHRLARTAVATGRALEPRVRVLAQLALFDGASEAALERLARGLHPVTLASGTGVIVQGDVPDDLYVIRRGTFDVVKDGVHVATLGPDDWFGEIGLLRQTPRTATVTAASSAEVWQIPGADFLATVNESSLLPSALLEGMTARLAQLDEIGGQAAGS